MSEQVVKGSILKILRHVSSPVNRNSHRSKGSVLCFVTACHERTEKPLADDVRSALVHDYKLECVSIERVHAFTAMGDQSSGGVAQTLGRRNCSTRKSHALGIPTLEIVSVGKSIATMCPVCYDASRVLCLNMQRRLPRIKKE